MSNYNRNSPFANSAIVISIDHAKRFGAGAGDSLFAGLKFRRSLETAAFQAVQKAAGVLPGQAPSTSGNTTRASNSGGKVSPHAIPAQRVVDFLDGRLGPTLPTSSPSGVAAVRLDQILPSDLVERMRHSLQQFNSKMKGFISEHAQFHGIESRTSCPVRMTRSTVDLESVSHAGLYPAGEGAGYAGGITSAACDGVKIADQIASLYTAR